MAVSSIAEVISISAVIPFLGVLTSPERVFEYASIKPIIRYLSIEKPSELIVPLTVTFCILSIVSGVFRFMLVWAATRIANSIGGDISVNIFRRTLYQPYLVHISRNSSEIISGISGKANSVVGGTILPITTLISAALMLAMVTGTLIVIEPYIALTAIMIFGLGYLFISLAVKRRLAWASNLISRNSTKVIKIMQEALGGIRDIILDKNQEIFVRDFRNADVSLRHAQATVQLIGVSPRFALESVGIVVISVMAMFMSQRAEGFAGAIPIFGALALGAQRLLPLLQQSYQSWASLRAGKTSLKDAVELLEQAMPIDGIADGNTRTREPFKNMELNNISFRYEDNSKWVLNNVSLSISKGEVIGILGVSGAGKSTLIDIILGLLHPQHGQVSVNGCPVNTGEKLMRWRSKLSHVPQDIYLSDSTISENIAFGKDPSDIDEKLVREVANRAQLAQTIEAWPSQYGTHVGERGAKLSGGQRQRIGIARALYKGAEVIILDEATSALDSKTEKDVMDAMVSDAQPITLILVTHRKDTLRLCDSLYCVDDGALKRTTYDKLAQDG